MSTSAASQLRQDVRDFVAGTISLRELRQHAIPAIYTADRWADPTTEELAEELILRFAEDDHGDWAEDDLRSRLAGFLTREGAESAPQLEGDGQVNLFVKAGTLPSDRVKRALSLLTRQEAS